MPRSYSRSRSRSRCFPRTAETIRKRLRSFFSSTARWGKQSLASADKTASRYLRRVTRRQR